MSEILLDGGVASAGGGLTGSCTILTSVDLLARTKRLAVRPVADEDMADTDWYALLTEAQLHWVQQIATMCPEAMYVFEKLTTADGGVSYSFGAEPLGHYELRRSPTSELMIPGAEWDPTADFVPNGQSIRFPGQVARSFANGPWGRYVQTPCELSATNEPILRPIASRLLLPPRACEIWASRGGLRDPKPYRDEQDRIWFGNPDKGQLGVLGALQTQVFLSGAAALPATGGYWWHYIDDGSGYTPGRG